MLELQGLVQGECVSGQMTESRMIRVYEDIFPMGSVTKYVKIVFTLLDTEQTLGSTVRSRTHVVTPDRAH